ncbi:MAG TPA: DUF3408 domain-containing protein [Niabella sp.]|uniref:DUF3408 domain-containing protein n=1 Tax=Chitinophaga pollutisoli TaxID=3133966 RepID=A0ABZ2YQN2_9BACT|nr:DUF3408 domain-containing protein [Niabella sp.]
MKKTNQKQRNTLRIAEYQLAFLTPTGFLAKDGKTVYVSPEFHEKISHIAFILGSGKINIADYLHSVLKHHFPDFGQEIKTIYNDKNKPIF